MENQALETWRNNGAGRVVLKQYGARGEMKDVMIAGGRTFTITPQERRINQEVAATEELDMFANGMLSPVRLLETEDDTKEIATNPNLISEGEMVELFKAHPKTFAKRLAEIKNDLVLSRLLEVAKEVDPPASKVAMVQERLAEIAPNLFVEIHSTRTAEAPSNEPSPDQLRKGRAGPGVPGAPDIRAVTPR